MTGGVPEKRSAYLGEGAATLAPLAFVKFCMGNEEECRPAGDAVALRLDEAAADVLRDVNRSVNREIQAERRSLRPGDVDAWMIGPARGDCNDYAVTKRHELVRRGVPASALMLSVARTAWGEGHLVLVVRTDRGDLVLDNLSERILPPWLTGHRFEKRQAAGDPQRWVTVAPSAPPAILDTAALAPASSLWEG